MENKTRILFVCLGNICRSPAAEGILRSMAQRRGVSDSFTIDSAGTYGGHAGDLPDPRMRRAAAARGYDLTHRARQVREEDFERFDALVVMDDMNYEALHRLAPSRAAAQRIYRMTEFCRRHPDRSYVPDPYYEGHEGSSWCSTCSRTAARGFSSTSLQSGAEVPERSLQRGGPDTEKGVLRMEEDALFQSRQQPRADTGRIRSRGRS